MGGGIFIQGASPTIRGNIIRDNFSTWNGAGVYAVTGYEGVDAHAESLGQESHAVDGSGTATGTSGERSH